MADSFEETLKLSQKIEADVKVNPHKYRVLTGDRPTGSLHIGHLFGSLENRVKLQNLGVETFIVIADYQVLTDRDDIGDISKNVYDLVTDYLAAGLDPENFNTHIFPHSHIPELNQLLLSFLPFISMPELDRNPTIKEEIRAAGLRTINASMYIYPIHQAADILFCRGNVIPVGKDQLPHLEMCRKVARRFNDAFAKENPVFQMPQPLLSKTPSILGLDGLQKMSKSRNNAIFLKDSADVTAKLLKRAKTDSERFITYDPENRPEVANLLSIYSLVTGTAPETLAEQIGNGGSGQLKKELTEALNTYLSPIREKRKALEADQGLVKDTLKQGIEKAREEAKKTLSDVQQAMQMDYSLFE